VLNVDSTDYRIVSWNKDAGDARHRPSNGDCQTHTLTVEIETQRATATDVPGPSNGEECHAFQNINTYTLVNGQGFVNLQKVSDVIPSEKKR
jgi:hypothetical protein